MEINLVAKWNIQSSEIEPSSLNEIKIDVLLTWCIIPKHIINIPTIQKPHNTIYYDLDMSPMVAIDLNKTTMARKHN